MFFFSLFFVPSCCMWWWQIYTHKGIRIDLTDWRAYDGEKYRMDYRWTASATATKQMCLGHSIYSIMFEVFRKFACTRMPTVVHTNGRNAAVRISNLCSIEMRERVACVCLCVSVCRFRDRTEPIRSVCEYWGKEITFTSKLYLSVWLPFGTATHSHFAPPLFKIFDTLKHRRTFSIHTYMYVRRSSQHKCWVLSEILYAHILVCMSVSIVMNVRRLNTFGCEWS